MLRARLAADLQERDAAAAAEERAARRRAEAAEAEEAAQAAQRRVAPTPLPPLRGVPDDEDGA